MNLIPPIANYFGVTIDELFGYSNQRESRINALILQLQQMKRKNNGRDADIGQTIAFARNALVEYPGDPHLMVCLASILYTAGYSRHGEHHLTDEEGTIFMISNAIGVMRNGRKRLPYMRRH